MSTPEEISRRASGDQESLDPDPSFGGPHPSDLPVAELGEKSVNSALKELSDSQ